MSEVPTENPLAQVQAHLGHASPWLRFLGIAGLITCATFAVVALIVILAGIFFPFGMFHSLSAGVSLGLVYLVLAGVLLVPAIFFIRLAKSAKQFRSDGDISSLETLGITLFRLTRYYGVILIVVLAVGALGLAFDILTFFSLPRG